MVKVSDPFRVGRLVVLPGGANEVGQQAPVSGIKVEVLLPRHIQIRLIQHHSHPQDTVVEVYDRLAIRAHKGQVMHTLNLDYRHIPASPFSL
jgi:hypothetical protein